MTECRTCKHFSFERGTPYCYAPQTLFHDPVWGVSRPRIAPSARKKDEPCGPEGKLWEPKE